MLGDVSFLGFWGREGVVGGMRGGRVMDRVTDLDE